MSTPARVYSYVRCSTAAQAGGDTFERQDAAAAAYCARQGWQLDDSLRLADEGRSAYSGAHLDDKAALGRFIRAASDGLVPRGSILLVDDQSRLSRMGLYDTMQLMHDLIDVHGVELVTLNNGQRYTPENWQDIGNWVVSGVGAALAHGESKEKARKIRSARKGNREAARTTGAIFTGQVPGWIRVVGRERDSKGRPHGGRLELIPERAALVARMFDLFLSGTGKRAIAAIFNDEKIPTWGGAPWWQPNYVFKIIRSPAAAGVWVPRVKNAARKFEAVEPIEGYFPAVIDADTFQRAEALAAVRRTSGRGGEIQSVLAGLAKCPACGSAMTRIGNNERSGGPKLVCVKAKAGADCPAPAGPRGGARRVSLPAVEAGLIAAADSLEKFSPLFDPELAGQRDQLEKRIAAKSAAIDNLLKLAESGNAPASILERIGASEKERDAMQRELAALGKRLALVESEGVALRVGRAVEALKSYGAGKLQAAAVNASLREIFDSIIVRDGTLECHWLYGKPPAVVAF